MKSTSVRLLGVWEPMPKQIYIAIGNHRSYVGIKELIYSLQSSLSDSFSVKLTRELKSDSVNIIIDEFSGLFDLAVIKKTKELYPNTKIVIIATEFATPVSVLGLELTKTFNFFNSPDDWVKLILGSLRHLAGGVPSYMQLRYVGFVRALQYCDLLAVIHPAICRRSRSWSNSPGLAFRHHSRSTRKLAPFPSSNWAGFGTFQSASP